MKLINISALQDNYIWILLNTYNNYCLIIDPGEAASILWILKKNKWKPEAIFITHHHYDHVNGIAELLSYFPNLVIYGPKEAEHHGISHIVKDNDSISLSHGKFSVFSTPGHTVGHLCFFNFPYLFCGDTLFSGGCGRVLEGTLSQMYYSLQKINRLPKKTLICCGHEYTLLNMEFAVDLFPDDIDIVNFYQKTKKLREKKQTTLPTVLKVERKINLFLRINDLHFIKKNCYLPKSAEERFAWLRKKRDYFRSTLNE